MTALYFLTNDGGGGRRWFRSTTAARYFRTNSINEGTGSYATVTLAAPLNLGPGSILNPAWFSGTPQAGDRVRYPQNFGFQVLPDGTIQCDTNSGVFPCFYDDGSGETAFTVTLTPNV